MLRILVDIALPLPLNQTFTYLVPPELHNSVEIGKRVFVPFGKKQLTGVIVAIPDNTNIQGLKQIIDVIDERPVYSSELLMLTKWIAEYYFTSWGESLKTAIPYGLTLRSSATVHLCTNDIEITLQQLKKPAPQQYEILKVLAVSKLMKLSQIQKKLHKKNIYSALSELHKRGLISIKEEIEKPKTKPKLKKFIKITAYGIKKSSDKTKEVKLSKKQLFLLEALQKELISEQNSIELNSFLKKVHVSLSSLKKLIERGILQIEEHEVFRLADYENEPLPDIRLNYHQQNALNEISNAISTAKFQTFLLHGITGSGKTQVYIEAIRNILSIGKNAIVLVPEISLTPQTVRRFKAHFSNDVAVMHSQMSAGERYDAWRMAYQGKVKIVIGPRSAIYAPLKNIGLIVVDEEHDGSYKQFDSSPRYNARDAAIVRASNIDAVVVLGSATPSIESYTNAVQGKYKLLELPQRIDTAQLPSINIMDMSRERHEVYNELKDEIRKSGKNFPKHLPHSSISRTLKSQISLRLENKEGTILLQNRRGFSHIMECFDCGYVEKCDNCDVSLTYHATKKHLRCHYCGFVKKPPNICPKCNSIELRMHSFGTQQIQEELEGIFPKANILRMDRDTTSYKGAHNNILKQFETGKADILLGTQMVAKGLDFPRVTLVGVISADTQMLLPDFRAAETTFQLLTQVSGRAGRSNLAGEVIIQTFQPSHYSLKYVVTHDYFGFYREELEYRRELDYPPFSRIVLLEFSGGNDNELQHHAKKFVEYLDLQNQQNRFIILGPADAAIPKINNVFRKHIIIKDLKSSDPNGSCLRSALLKVKMQYESSVLFKNKGIKLIIDVDPQGMM